MSPPKYGYKIQMMRSQNPAKSGKAIKHRMLIYGGLGDVAINRIIPALRLLKNEFDIEFGLVDLKDEVIGKYYKYGTEPLQDYNIAIIATPNNTHASIAIRALNSGLNILCEKPLAHTTESAKQILLAAQSHPRSTSMSCDHYLYKPSVRNVLRNWGSYQEEIGTIINIEAKVFEQELQKGRDWLFSHDISGGGITMDTGFHIVSIMGKLFGYENLTVTGAKMTRYPQSPGDAETYASITLNAGEIPIHIEVGKWMGKIQKQIVFRGNKAMLEVDIESGQIILNGETERPATKDDSYPVLLREFFSAIEGQRPPWTTLDECYEVLRIIVTAYGMAGLAGKI